MKSQYSQLRPSAPPAVPALSAHVLRLQHSPQPILALLDPGRRLSPVDGYGGCSGSVGGIRLSCFIRCCLRQIPTVCWFLGASNCCLLRDTDVVSSVASVQPPDTSVEENSARCMDLHFVLNTWHRVLSHLTIARTVNRNVGPWDKILSLHCAAVFTLQPPGSKPRSSSKNWLEKLLPVHALLERRLSSVTQGTFPPPVPYSGSSQAHLKLLEKDIMSIFPNFFVLTDVSCLSSETGLFKNRYYVPLNSTNHMGMGLFLSLAAYNLSFFFF